MNHIGNKNTMVQWYHHYRLLPLSLAALLIVLFPIVPCQSFSTPSIITAVEINGHRSKQHVHSVTSSRSSIGRSSLCASPNTPPAFDKSDDVDDPLSTVTRRTAIRSAISKYAVVLAAATTTTTTARPSLAAVTDETGSSENSYADSAYNRRTLGLDASDTPPSSDNLPQSQRATTDEYRITVSVPSVNDSGLGLQLADIEFQTNRRVYVRTVSPGSLAERLGVRKDWILVSINGATTERTDAKGAATIVGRALRTTPEDGSLDLVFRDPGVFRDQILNLGDGQVATTQVAPSGDTTQRKRDGSIRVGEEKSQDDQRLSVESLVEAKYCQRRAVQGDLMEISYLGTVLETGAVFDGGAIKINGEVVPGRGNDTTIFFVLGKQPFGQFPPSWDVGLEGICVGERRRLIVPPVLGFGAAGVPRRNIPPNAALQYDVTLVSLNGLATP